MLKEFMVVGGGSALLFFGSVQALGSATSLMAVIGMLVVAGLFWLFVLR